MHQRPRTKAESARRFRALPEDVRKLITAFAHRLDTLPDQQCADAIESIDRVAGKVMRERGPASCPR